MIKVDYLSEVEALYVQQEALIERSSVPDLFAVWAEVGRDVHGFVARVKNITQHSTGRVAQFAPVTDIAVLRYRMVDFGDGKLTAIDPRKRLPKDLMQSLVHASPRKDEDAICGDVPTIGEDVTVTI